LFLPRVYTYTRGPLFPHFGNDRIHHALHTVSEKKGWSASAG